MRAKKCPHCGSFQNLRRHLQSSSTILSLLVALVSVLGLVIPVVVDVFRIEKSEIAVSLRNTLIDVHMASYVGGSEMFDIDSYGVVVRLLLTNSGKRSGFIDFANVSLRVKNQPFSNADLKIKPRAVSLNAESF